MPSFSTCGLPLGASSVSVRRDLFPAWNLPLGNCWCAGPRRVTVLPLPNGQLSSIAQTVPNRSANVGSTSAPRRAACKIRRAGRNNRCKAWAHLIAPITTIAGTNVQHCPRLDANGSCEPRQESAGLMKPLDWISQFVFGCHHKHLSRVFTIKKRTYQVCLACGYEFDYSWALMHSRPNIAESSNAPLGSPMRVEVSVI